jgi:putative membrane protein
MGFMLIFWIAVIVGVVYLVRYSAGRPSAGTWQDRPLYWQTPGSPGATGGGSNALRILEDRYARGEIDREEFQERKADLSS